MMNFLVVVKLKKGINAEFCGRIGPSQETQLMGNGQVMTK